ncbi:MAG: cupin domain-containing protein [candidate division Zixibacteria bacterium]|nr:cupin domain-containing protein [candidate division Zixibacteria bacterium]
MMNAVSVNVNDMEWQVSGGYSAGAEEKVLSVGGSIAPRTILLKIPSGWSMDAHSHIHTELHYVLEGEYESKGETYRSGTFRVIPKGVEHGPFASKTGAIILVTWCTLQDK